EAPDARRTASIASAGISPSAGSSWWIRNAYRIGLSFSPGPDPVSGVDPCTEMTIGPAPNRQTRGGRCLSTVTSRAAPLTGVDGSTDTRGVLSAGRFDGYGDRRS